jgi:signal transduction histidine kinase
MDFIPRKLTIGKKTLLIVTGVSLLLCAILLISSEEIFRRQNQNLEIQQVEQTLQRGVGALDSRSDALNSYGKDWSNWDDTYLFVKDGNEQYIIDNLMDATFINAKVNLMIFIDTSGNIVYGKAFNLNENIEIPIPPEIENNAPFIGSSVLNSTNNSGITGIISTSEGPLLMSASPILDSEGEGLSNGTMIVGQFLDQSVINDISKTTLINLDFYQLSDTQVTMDISDIAHRLSINNPVLIRAKDKNNIVGYELIEGIDKKPVMILKISMDRDFYNNGLTTLRYFEIYLVGACFIFVIVFILVLKKYVIGKIIDLSKNVNSIERTRDITQRLSISDYDEVALLGRSINNMLGTIEKIQNSEKESRQLIDRVLATIPNAVAVINKEFKINLANRAFCEALQQTRESITGKGLSDIIEALDLVKVISASQLNKGSYHVDEFRHIINGIERIYVVDTFTLGLSETLIIMNDITIERKRQDNLYQTDRLVSVGEMAAGIAHELNNPLTSVISLSELLSEDDLPGEVANDILSISKEAKRAKLIVKNMLAFSRKHKSEMKNTNPGDVINDVLNLRAYEQKVNNIQTIVHIEPDLPVLTIDYFELQQVFLNIILNAEQAILEAKGRGNIEIKAEFKEGMARVSFIDDGPGIQPENLKRIFDPFFTTKEVGKGTGLGLSICYGIVTAHRGKIYAESEYGKGATLVVELPV